MWYAITRASFSRQLVMGILVFLLPLLAWPWAVRSQVVGWQVLGLRGSQVTRVQVEGSEGLALIYAEAGSSLWRTIDGGISWTRIDGGWPRDGIGRSRLTVWRAAPAQGRVLYVLTSWPERSAVYRSMDGGSTWEPGIALPSVAGDLAISPGNPDHVYTTGGRRYWASRDGGMTWRELTSPGQGEALMLAVGWDKAHTLYAATTEGALWLSENGGLSWTRGQGLPEDTWSALAPASDGQTVYLTGARGFYRSRDGGHRWYSFPLPGGQPVIALAVDRLVAQAVYAVTANRRIVGSSDGGETWQSLARGPGGSEVLALSVSGLDRTRIYAGTEAGVWVHPVVPPSPVSTPSPTPTPTRTPKSTATPTPTATATSTLTGILDRPGQASTPTSTPTVTVTPSTTPTPTFTPMPSPSPAVQVSKESLAAGEPEGSTPLPPPPLNADAGDTEKHRREEVPSTPPPPTPLPTPRPR